MKVNDSKAILSISLKGDRSIYHAVKNLKIGESVAAGIIKSEGREAILDIRGKRVRAEFLNGVPDRKVVELILTDKSASSVVFRLADKNSGDNLSGTLPMLTLLSEKELQNISIHSLVKFITGGRPDLLELNLFLLGLRKDDKKSGRADLFTLLKQRGASFNSLVYLNYLLSRNTPFMVIQYLFPITGDNRKMNHHSVVTAEPDDELFDIIGNEDNDLIKAIIDLFSDNNNGKALYEEAFLPGDEEFIKCEYVYYENGFFCTLELSALGRLDIIIKDYDDTINIMLFSEKDDVLIYLNEKKENLENILEQNNIKNAIILVSDRKKMVDKISMWATEFYMKSGFDVKV